MLQTILIVEDDHDLLRSLDHILTEEGYVVTTASEGSKALSITKKIKPDLVMLDVGLPDISGESVCKDIKSFDPQTPVILLTGNDKSEDVVRGLNLGADDYITKPFQPDELLARIKATLRVMREPTSVVKIGDLEINPQTFDVKRKGKTIPLTQTEFQLLMYLARNKGQVLTREMILNHVWSYAPDIESRVVDVYIGYLRRKLESGASQKYIHSVRGFGYVLKDPTES
ncbi:MAG TPA: response regulator transcription factor [Candidatus Saccharimonadia bacterium]|nr:response regulator transcription factor [Candidatus Saccharimonadia bacterium]